MAADNHKNVLKSLEKAVQAVEDVQMPLSEDHYFYANFPEFKSQVNGFVGQVRSILSAFPGAPPTSEETFEETDEATDWVTGLLDDTLARVNFALADAKRTCEPATDTTAAERAPLVLNITEPGDGGAGQVKGALALPPSKGKGKGQAFVTYMNSTMREKPQEAFADRVDNSNIPFVHKLGNLEGIIDIEAAEEEALAAKIARRPRPHPLQSLLDSFTYPEWQVQLPTDPHMYKGFDATPFEFVNTVAALTRVAARLATARELAVDLEAHNYRSFQGFCCLMQLSTRSEDIIVDVMTLRAHVGKALGPIFANPAIVKVLHGSDGDIIWLQRDFGIYVCNLFDTGQAARVLSYPGHGLAYLLQRHCGFKADKRWQLADWRLRPLSEDALHYARADTHYLLYCYDVVRKELADLSQSKVLQHLVVNIPPGRPGGPLGLVLERSRQLCLHQYEKELLTETSFLTLYAKLPNQALSDEQLAAFAALYAWRDRVAREEDESLGYVLSRNQLLSLASEANMLVSPQDVLRRVGRGASPLVHRRAMELFTEIQASRSNAARAAKLWRQWREVHPDFLNRGLGSPVLVDFQAAAAAAAASLAPSIMPPQKTSSEDESLEEGERRDDDNDSVAQKENPSGAQDMQMPRLQPKPLEKPLQLKPAGHSTAGSILAGNPPPTFASISMGSAAITKGNSFATLPVKSTAFGASGFSSIIARSVVSIPGSLADPGIPADVSKKLASIKAAMALPFTSAVNAPSSTMKDGGAEVENVDSGNDVVHKNQGTQAQVVREAVALMRRSDKEALENNEAAGREDANEPVLDTTRLLNAGSLQNEVEDFMPLSLTEQYGLKHGKRRLQRLHGNNRNNRNKRDRSVDEDTTNAVNTRTAKEKKIKRTLQELGLEESEEEVAVGSAPQQPELQPTAGINITEAVQKYDVGIVNPHRNQQRGGFRGRRGPSRGRGGRAGRGRGSGGSHSNRGRGREEKAGPPTGRFNPYAGLDLSGVKVGKRSAVNVRSGNRSASFK